MNNEDLNFSLNDIVNNESSDNLCFIENDYTLLFFRIEESLDYGLHCGLFQF